MAGWPFQVLICRILGQKLSSWIFYQKKAGEERKDGKLSVHTCCSSSWHVGKDHVGLPFQHIFNVLKICQCFNIFNFIKEQGTEEAEKKLISNWLKSKFAAT